MKNLQNTITEINKTIIEVQENMNALATVDLSLMVDDDIINIVVANEDDIMIKIPIDEDENYLEKYDSKTVLLYCISYLYNNNIRQYKSFISRTKTLYKNRIKKLNKLMSEFDDKIEADIFNKNFAKYTNLVSDLTIRYSENEEVENSLQFCKDAVQTMYETLNVLYKDWKQEDIAEYVTKHGHECKLNDNKDKLEVVIKDKETKEELGNITIKIDNYSRKNNVMNIIRLKEQELKEQISA